MGASESNHESDLNNSAKPKVCEASLDKFTLEQESSKKHQSNSDTQAGTPCKDEPSRQAQTSNDLICPKSKEVNLESEEQYNEFEEEEGLRNLVPVSEIRLFSKPSMESSIKEDTGSLTPNFQQNATPDGFSTQNSKPIQVRPFFPRSGSIIESKEGKTPKVHSRRSLGQPRLTEKELNRLGRKYEKLAQDLI